MSLFDDDRFDRDFDRKFKRTFKIAGAAALLYVLFLLGFLGVILWAIITLVTHFT